jgi:hypothetical protein
VKIESWMPAVAARLGLTAEQYAAKLAAGLRWCTGCKKWEREGLFGRDRSRPSGYSTRCKAASALLETTRQRQRRERQRAKRASLAEAVLAEVYEMLRARKPHGAIADHIVATVGRP